MYLKTKKIHFVSLGCARNLVDSEVMVGLTARDGYEVTAEAAKADVIVVNTCGFVESAKVESIETILEMADMKERGRCETLVMTGCLAQRYPDELQRDLPEVDYFLGTGEFPRIAEVLKEKPKTRGFFRRPKFLYEDGTPRVHSGKRHSAFLKIAEGCSTRCAFCIIPKLRGPLRSRPVDDVVAEARRLAEEGVRELNLIAQDSTDYGADLGHPDALAELLSKLSDIHALRWLRVHYMYPDKVRPSLVRAFAELPKVVPYVDMPIQHASDRVLASMHRSVTGDGIRRVLADFKKTLPDAALRTGVIVGFPGETETEFQELEAFLAETKFDHLGVFTYSHEEGTPAAKLADDIPADVKEARRAALMQQQEAISKKKLRKMVGKTVDVLIDGVSPESEHLLVGRMKTQGPDVDGVVYVNDGEANAGDIVPVKIVEAHVHDLVGGITKGKRDPAPPPKSRDAKPAAACEPEHHDLERAGGATRTRVGLIIS